MFRKFLLNTKHFEFRKISRLGHIPDRKLIDENMSEYLKTRAYKKCVFFIISLYTPLHIHEVSVTGL